LHSLKSTKFEPIVQQVVDIECKAELLGGNQSLAKLIENFLNQNIHSLSHRFAAAKAYLVLDETKHDNLSKATKQKVIELCNPKLKDLKIQPLHQDCRPIYEFLLTLDNETAIDFKSQCSQLFPLTPYFNDNKKKHSTDEDIARTLTEVMTPVLTPTESRT